MATLGALLALVTWLVEAAGAGEKPLPPAEARKHVGEKVTAEMLVKATKSRLEKRGEIYLDSEEDFRDKKNLAVIINRAGAGKFKAAGINDPAAHFKGKTIRVTGTVTVVEDVPRIVVEDPQQITVVGKKP
jgi:hypothetical protein